MRFSDSSNASDGKLGKSASNQQNGKGSAVVGVMVTGTDGKQREVDEKTASDCSARVLALAHDHPWLSRMDGAVRAIVNADVTHRKRYMMMRSFADRVNAAVASQSACSKSCSSCCHIQVEMSGWEAGHIGRELGLTVHTPAQTQDTASAAEALFGRPCGFLNDDRCSIYVQRPLACRLHHNISDSAQMCSTSVLPAESIVPTMDLRSFWAGYAYVSMGSGAGDISSFFAEARRGPRVPGAAVSLEMPLVHVK